MSRMTIPRHLRSMLAAVLCVKSRVFATCCRTAMSSLAMSAMRCSTCSVMTGRLQTSWGLDRRMYAGESCCTTMRHGCSGSGTFFGGGRGDARWLARLPDVARGSPCCVRMVCAPVLARRGSDDPPSPGPPLLPSSTALIFFSIVICFRYFSPEKCEFEEPEGSTSSFLLAPPLSSRREEFMRSWVEAHICSGFPTRTLFISPTPSLIITCLSLRLREGPMLCVR
mmetsp:Transcript_36307/g.114595  ORF Transcript_36307/g.114595 Transcript_36307/m.114595 type:complete len:225 (-) Transcript_36307:511-1185(-)